MEQFLKDAGISLLLTAAFGYYAFRLLVLKDIRAIRGKNEKKVKNEERYVKEAGKLMAFLMVSSLVMAAITCFSSIAALVQIAVCFLIFGFLWKRMNENYGA